jgi:hypothetical protein
METRVKNRLLGINGNFVTCVFPMLALLLVGCGPPDEPADCAPPENCVTSPLYAISTIVFSEDLTMRQEYVKFSDGLEADSTIDEMQSIEFPSPNPTLWPSTKLGEFFIADSSNGDLQKYGFETDGSVMKTGSPLSFAAHGVTKTNWPLLIVHSETQGFFFDEITEKGFVWNPKDMTITKDFDLASAFTPTEGTTTYTVWRERSPIKIGNKYFVSYKYFNLAALETLYARSGMLVIDADAGTFTTVETTACGGLFHSVLGSDGLIYAATGVVGAAGQFNAQVGAAPACMVRFDPNAMKWDTAYNVDLASLVGTGKFVGSIFAPDQKDGAVYTRVLLEASAPTGKTALQLTAAPLWETFKIDNLANPTTATKIDGLRPAGGVPYPFYVDGESYTAGVNLSAKPNQSWIVNFTADPPIEQLEMPGWGYFAIRVR